jgi:hypothetical protein
VSETEAIDQVNPQLIYLATPLIRIGSQNTVFADVGADAIR